MALNPELLSILRRLFGKVEVYNENVWGDWEIVKKPRPDGSVAQYYRHRRGGNYGEQYCLNCPFCGDKKQRFRVSHMFARWDETIGRYVRAGLHCFNEDCHENQVYVSELFEDIQYRARAAVAIAQEAGEDGDVSVPDAVEQARPGVCQSLLEVADKEPHHPAIEFLVGRGFDLEHLSRYYGVMLLQRGYRWRMLDGRIFIPFWRREHLVAWSARAVDPAAERKYINSSGNLGGLLYGLRSAMACEVAVAVEGPPDRWAVGDASFAVLSKSFGANKQQRLREAMVSPMRRCSLMVSLFDPEQPANEKAKGLEHQIPKMARQLTEVTGLETIPIALPQWLDPGGSDGRFLADYLERQLKYVGHERLGKVLSRSVRRSSATCQRV